MMMPLAWSMTVRAAVAHRPVLSGPAPSVRAGTGAGAPFRTGGVLGHQLPGHIHDLLAVALRNIPQRTESHIRTTATRVHDDALGLVDDGTRGHGPTH